jgi:TolB-like protein
LTDIQSYSGEKPFFFVCYSHADQNTVGAEMQWMHEAGVRLWYDEGIEVGTTWRQALADALNKAVGVIFMCSAHSLASSHCRKELSFALDHDKPILVVRLDDTELPPELGLYLSDTQLLERDRYQPAEYRQKLLTALNRFGSSPVEQPPSIPQPKRPVANVALACATLVVLAAVGLGYFYLPVQNNLPVKENDLQPSEIRFPTVAIIPMEILTEDEVLDYVARASEEDLRRRMQASVYEPVNVPDAALEMSVTEIGQLYGVDFVWYRSVAKQGEVVRIGKRLADTRNGEDVAVYRHDLTGSDPFELQDELAKYTEEIMVSIDKGMARRIDEMPLEQMNAWELNYTSKGNRKENIRRALAMAPDLYSAHSAAAWDLWEDWYMQRTDDPKVPAEALKLARRGWELAPFDQYSSIVAAQVEIGVGRPERAVSYMRRFFDLKSISSPVFYETLIVTDQADIALEHAKSNPLAGQGTLANIYLALGRYEDAVEHSRKVTELFPNSILAWYGYANMLAYLGRTDEVDQIIAGLEEAGQGFSVDGWERGVKRYWGKSDFGDKQVSGFRKAGYE